MDMAKTKTFSVNTTKTPDTLVSEARQIAEENDDPFKGDRNSGRFSGNGVEGGYEVEGKTITVTITDKPTLAPWPTLESRMKEFFQASAWKRSSRTLKPYDKVRSLHAILLTGGRGGRKHERT
jgi:hypothetical protein